MDQPERFLAVRQGSRPSRAAGVMAGRLARAPDSRASRIRRDIAAIVGEVKSSLSGIQTANSRLIRTITCVAESECPPSSKKSS